jgi:hypothetical protein
MLDILIPFYVDCMRCYWRNYFMGKLGITHNKALVRTQTTLRSIFAIMSGVTDISNLYDIK